MRAVLSLFARVTRGVYTEPLVFLYTNLQVVAELSSKGVCAEQALSRAPVFVDGNKQQRDFLQISVGYYFPHSLREGLPCFS